MGKIDILYDVVGGNLLVVQSAFHFSSVKESRKEEACAVVLAEHNHTLPMGEFYTQYLYTVLSHGGALSQYLHVYSTCSWELYIVQYT